MRKLGLSLLIAALLSVMSTTYADAQTRRQMIEQDLWVQAEICGFRAKHEKGGWKARVLPKGTRRFKIGTWGTLAGTVEYDFTIHVYNLDTCKPHKTTVWYKSAWGKNVKLAKGSSMHFKIRPSLLDRRSIRGWASKKNNLIVYLRVYGPIK